MATTLSHSRSRVVNEGGFAQRVNNPSNPQSRQLAAYNSSVQVALVPIKSGTSAYTGVLPTGAVIISVELVTTTAFAGGTSPAFSVGSTVGGTDILASTSLTSTAHTSPANGQLANSGQVVYVTVTGAPTSGAGYVVVEYVNPAVTINGLID